MKAELLILLAGGAGTGLMVYAGASLVVCRNRGKRGESHRLEERRTLAEISSLWTRREPVVHFKDIARIWREVPQAEVGKKQPRPVFRHPEIDTFFADWVENRAVLKGNKRAVIEAILSILDREGDCPSVVRKSNTEAEAKLDADVFALLATIPLWRHTLAVAQAMAKKVTQEVMLPDTLIVALGHDLGKIPAHLDALYRTGDHPLVSLILLHRIPEFEAMSNREEVAEAIRQHHLIKADSPLGAALKEADWQVRLEEISRLTRPKPQPQPAAPQMETAPVQSAGSSSADDAASRREREEDCQVSERKGESLRHALEEETVLGSPAPENLLKQDPTHQTTVPCREKGSTPAWFDPQAILAGLLARVNVLKAGRWSVVSSPEGLVFAQPDALWSVVKKVAGKDPEVLAADGDVTGKRALLLLVVRELSRQRKAIATEFVAEGYYTTQCIVVMEGGRTIQVPLVPFRVEAFGMPPSALESRKVNELQKMVRIIKPKQIHGRGESCGIFD